VKRPRSEGLGGASLIGEIHAINPAIEEENLKGMNRSTRHRVVGAIPVLPSLAILQRVPKISTTSFIAFPLSVARNLRMFGFERSLSGTLMLETGAGDPPVAGLRQAANAASHVVSAMQSRVLGFIQVRPSLKPLNESGSTMSRGAAERCRQHHSLS
jgi:hypothetical protein